MRIVKPLGSQILVREVNPAGDVKSSVIIPDSARRTLREAVVISTGPGYRINPTDGHFFSPLQVKKGDRIMYNSNAQMFHIDLPDGENGRFIMMDENAIVAKLEEIPNG